MKVFDKTTVALAALYIYVNRNMSSIVFWTREGFNQAALPSYSGKQFFICFVSQRKRETAIGGKSRETWELGFPENMWK